MSRGGRFSRIILTDPTQSRVVGGGAEQPLRQQCLNSWQQWNPWVARHMIGTYGHVMAHVPVYVNNNQDHPAATVYNWGSGQMQIVVNNAQMEGLRDTQKAAIITHEFLHILCNHFQRILAVDPKVKTDPEVMQDANIAADYSINPFIKDLPLTLPAVPDFHLCFPNQQGMKAGHAVEWYYEKIRKKRAAEEKQQQGKQGDPGDAGESGKPGDQGDPTGHRWEERVTGKPGNTPEEQQKEDAEGAQSGGSPTLGAGPKPKPKPKADAGETPMDPETMEQMAKAAENIRKKVFSELMDNGMSPDEIQKQMMPMQQYGTEPGDLTLTGIVRGAGKLSWNMEIKSIGDGLPTATNFRWSNMRRDKRFGTRPGLTFERAGKVLAALDVSGSVTSHEFNGIPAIDVMLTELVKLYQSVRQIDVVLADTKVRAFLPGYKGHHKLKIVGGGGTNYNCVFEWMEQQHRKYAMLIFFGDGETYPVQDQWKKLNVPTLWVTLPHGDHGSKYCSFGKTIWMTAPEGGR
jgi:predicted metal-dependent peptidase